MMFSVFSKTGKRSRIHNLTIDSLIREGIDISIWLYTLTQKWLPSLQIFSITSAVWTLGGIRNNKGICWAQIHQKHLGACRQLKMTPIVYQQNKASFVKKCVFWNIYYSVSILKYLVTLTYTHKNIKQAEKQNTFLWVHIKQLLLHLVHSVHFFMAPTIFT